MNTTNGSTDDFEDYPGVNPLGEKDSWRLRPTQSVPNPNSLLVVDLVQLSDSSRAERKRLPDAVKGEEDWILAEAQLDNEIRALVRLATRYPNDYPAELPRLIGYNFDAAEPFVLMRSAAPESVRGDLGIVTLLNEERKRFQIGIYRAVAALHAVELVHGAIQLSSVRWSADDVQLVGFEHSAGCGEVPRSRSVTLSHRVRGADRTANPEEDVRNAGLAYFELVAGRRPDRELRDRDQLTEVVGTALLDVFGQDPANRPSAVEVLSALGCPTDPPDPIDVDEALRLGWERFDTDHPVLVPRRPGPTTPSPLPSPLPPLPEADPPVPARGGASTLTKTITIGATVVVLLFVAGLILMWMVQR